MPSSAPKISRRRSSRLANATRRHLGARPATALSSKTLLDQVKRIISDERCGTPATTKRRRRHCLGLGASRRQRTGLGTAGYNGPFAGIGCLILALRSQGIIMAKHPQNTALDPFINLCPANRNEATQSYRITGIHLKNFRGFSPENTYPIRLRPITLISLVQTTAANRPSSKLLQTQPSPLR